jgi:pimeloyl-ACP methyl ester carboxylesterase
VPVPRKARRSTTGRGPECVAFKSVLVRVRREVHRAATVAMAVDRDAEPSDSTLEVPPAVAASLGEELAEFPWRYARHLPTRSQVAALAKIGLLALRGRHSDAAETLLRSAYAYCDGGSAWDTFPEEWRRVARKNARAALADFRNSIGVYPSRTDLATVQVPVVCTCGARSPNSMFRLVQSLAAAIPTATTRRIEGAGHAAPFDATANFVQLIVDAITTSERDLSTAAVRPD